MSKSKKNPNRYVGSVGIATKCAPVPKETAPALIDSWLVETSAFLPNHRFYSVSVIHTRPIEGVRRPYLLAPDVTHEIFVIPLNNNRNPNAKFFNTRQPVLPEIYRGQVTSLTDLGAQVICECIAKAIADKILPALHGYNKVYNGYVAQMRGQMQEGSEYFPADYTEGKG